MASNVLCAALEQSGWKVPGRARGWLAVLGLVHGVQRRVAEHQRVPAVELFGCERLITKCILQF